MTLTVDHDGTTTDVVVNGETAMAALSDAMVQPGFIQKLPSVVYRMSAGDLQYASPRWSPVALSRRTTRTSSTTRSTARMTR